MQVGAHVLKLAISDDQLVKCVWSPTLWPFTPVQSALTYVEVCDQLMMYGIASFIHILISGHVLLNPQGVALACPSHAL